MPTWRSPRRSAPPASMSASGAGTTATTSISDIANAVAAIDRYEPYAYIADIENGVGGASWSIPRAMKFSTAVKDHLGGKPLVVSSFGYIVAHEPEIMSGDGRHRRFLRAAGLLVQLPRILRCSPADDPALGGLPTDNAAAYAKLCLHHWRRFVSQAPGHDRPGLLGRGRELDQGQGRAEARGIPRPSSTTTTSSSASTGGTWPIRAPCPRRCAR